MRFADRHPGAPIDFQVPGRIVVHLGPPAAPCARCGTPSEWWDLGLECPVCSEECHEAEWVEFEVAWNAATERHGPFMLDDLLDGDAAGPRRITTL
jgi:endogenous inhibitor of DNA gyrase (YacG/DUF329 family)